MRSAFRLFMASIVLTVAAGFALAQEASEPPPPPAPDAAVPVAELPPIPLAAPVEDPNAPPVDPAITLTIDPSALAVAPAAVAIVEPPAPEKPVVATTTTGVTKKTAKPVAKPVAKPEIEANEAFGPLPAAAAPVAAAPSKLDSMTPADAAASTVPARSIAPAPAAVDSATVETLPESTEPQTGMGIGGWLLAGIVVVAMVGLITWFRRRRTQRKISIVEFPQFSPELKPLPVSRF